MDEIQAGDPGGDEFEREIEYRGKVLYRDKVVARKLALVALLMTLFLVAAGVWFALGFGSGVTFIAKLSTWLLIPLGPFVLLTRTVLRTLVTSEQVVIRWGLWGPTIALDRITRCEVLDLKQVRVEQDQLRRAKDKRKVGLYAPGHFSAWVWLEWSDADGTLRAALVGSDQPDELARVINQARSARGAGKLRVEARAQPALTTGGADELDESSETDGKTRSEDASRS